MLPMIDLLRASRFLLTSYFAIRGYGCQFVDDECDRVPLDDD